MSGTKDFDRFLLPRWVNSKTSLAVNVPTTSSAGECSKDQFDYIALEREWDRVGTLYTAVELVSAASLYGDWDSPSALRAAKFVETCGHANPFHKQISASFLRGDCLAIPDMALEGEGDASEQIGGLRKHLSVNPMDTLAWLDISHAYALNSDQNSCLRAMQVALELGGSSPFVVRSAARAFLHYGDHTKALSILRDAYAKTANLVFAVSEVAISQQCKKRSVFDKLLVQKFKSPSNALFKSAVWSEIGATVATIELFSGAHKKAKKAALSVSDRISNENVLAQLEWLAGKEHFSIANRPTCVADFEADAISAYNKGDLSIAARHCLGWARFQPFSSAPGMHGSYIASVALVDFELAERLAAYAYRFSKDEFMSTNNYAFAVAANGEPLKALKIFSGVASGSLETKDFLTFLATSGFILLKIGELEAGRSSYLKAIDEFKRIRHRKSYAIASHFWMMADPQARTETRLREVKALAKSENISELNYFFRHHSDYSEF